MTNEQSNNGDGDSASSKSGKDQGFPQVSWDLGLGSANRTEVLWRCNALRAGKLYQRSLFGTQMEAEEFARKMRYAEPDQMFNVESIMASAVWN